MSNPETPPPAVTRSGYRPSDYTIDSVDLRFSLHRQQTRVNARLDVRRLVDQERPLVLDGEDLELVSLMLDGQPLPPENYEADEEHLTITGLPERFVLETEVLINPEQNSELSGLYMSNNIFCTQCEAQGFRRITYFLDRPDIMARYTTTIEGDFRAYPVMLSNGNRVSSEAVAGGRHRTCWEDPFPKPCYLFALVAGDLACERGSMRTRSGRDVDLEIWGEHHNTDRCGHALQSLKRAMAWDEEVFGLEYDLDLYMIVAVSDFNMGAMENKGLNIFNAKYVLAKPETATDDDYESIEGVIGHEYFHNWTGNRVTCRDWFQLTLKEGLTVFRDQEFSADMTSGATVRIGSVNALRSRQFAEDASPMAHPVRPESYIEMDNFYTATVYEKGAEVIRMIHTLLGPEGFRKGMDLYFERHDGTAVTCDDFREAMASATGTDLRQFEQWYTQSGTPRLVVDENWDEDSHTLELTITQLPPESCEDKRAPLHIPIRLGLVGMDGKDCPLVLPGEALEGAPTEQVLELRETRQSFQFGELEQRPLPSVLRGFSAPVIVKTQRTAPELAFLLAHDSDPFNRWDAGQELFGSAILEMSDASANGQEMTVSPALIDAFEVVMQNESMDGSLRALALRFPSERELAQRTLVILPDHLRKAREFLRCKVAQILRDPLLTLYRELEGRGSYKASKQEIDRRRLRNRVLSYLTAVQDPELLELAWTQFKEGDNMTDSAAALTCLSHQDTPWREEALDLFYQRWSEDPLVLDKWFSIQAGSTLEGAADRIRELLDHPLFSLTNPNRVRSVLAVYSTGNLAGFHENTGTGYELLADNILAIDPKNPQLAARLAGAFLQWRRYLRGQRVLMQEQVHRIWSARGLSRNTYEIVAKALD